MKKILSAIGLLFLISISNCYADDQYSNAGSCAHYLNEFALEFANEYSDFFHSAADYEPTMWGMECSSDDCTLSIYQPTGLCGVLSTDAGELPLNSNFFLYMRNIVAPIIQGEIDRYNTNQPFDGKKSKVMLNCPYKKGTFVDPQKCVLSYS